MKRILLWGDYTLPTGFSNVLSNIIRRLDPAEYDVTVLGIGFSGNPDYDVARYPGKVFPARPGVAPNHPKYADMYGRQRLLDLVRDKDFDLVFLLQDISATADIMQLLQQIKKVYNKDFKIIYYFPIDGPVQDRWLAKSVGLTDYAVAYDRFGWATCDACLSDAESRVKIIPHGVDTNDFFPMAVSREDFAATNDLNKDRFWLLNVNRNQPRKWILGSLLTIKILKERYDPDRYFLYLHMSNEDPAGENIRSMADQLGLIYGTDYYIPESLLLTEGEPIEHLNRLYNTSSVTMTTSLGEGCGLSILEAMATRSLTVAPEHTSFLELMENKRGVRYACRSKYDLMTIANDNSHLRPQPDINSLASRISLIDKFQHEYQIHKSNAHSWIKKERDWDIVVKQWLDLFDEAYDSLLRRPQGSYAKVSAETS